MSDQQNLEVIIIGGSVGGLACAHALLQAGNCSITIFERASSVSAAGAVRAALSRYCSTRTVPYI